MTDETQDGPGVGDPAPDSEVFTAAGEPVTLSSRLDRGPTAIVFLRHYG